MSDREVISDEECAGYARPRVGRGRRTHTGPLPDPVTLPGWSRPLPRLIRATQAAALKRLTKEEFLRLAALGLTPKAIGRKEGYKVDRWHLDEIRSWIPYRVSYQDGSSRLGVTYTPHVPRTRQVFHEGKVPTPVPLTPEAHHLYRHFDSNGQLLYVGISLSFVGRLSEHASRSKWFWQIARVEVTGYATEADALIAEQIAIYREQPLHNIRHARRKA